MNPMSSTMWDNFVAQLLGQTLLAMDVSDADLRQASGEAVDLLLWIPKKGAPVVPGDMRPLQLPPCFRRPVGVAIAEVVAPLVEPRLSPGKLLFGWTLRPQRHCHFLPPRC